MRVSKQAARRTADGSSTRRAELLREHGIDRARVDAITEASGLTHGAFYSSVEASSRLLKNSP